MTKPRDFFKIDHTGWVKIARIYSNAISPPVMFAIVGLVFSLTSLPFWPGLLWAALYGFFVSLAPIIFVLYMLRTGRIRELHMSNTRERHLPYLTAILFALIAYAVLVLADGPPLLRCLALFNSIELTLLFFINIFWLISLHSTGIMATLMLIGYVFGWPPAILLVGPVVLSVIWVRLYLKRHTPLQVAAGLLLGIVTVSFISLLGCF